MEGVAVGLRREWEEASEWISEVLTRVQIQIQIDRWDAMCDVGRVGRRNEIQREDLLLLGDSLLLVLSVCRSVSRSLFPAWI